MRNIKSPFRTCEFCLYFLRGRNRIDYCNREIHAAVFDESIKIKPRTIGDTCKSFTPKDDETRAIIEAAEFRYGYCEEDNGEDEVQDL